MSILATEVIAFYSLHGLFRNWEELHRDYALNKDRG